MAWQAREVKEGRRASPARAVIGAGEVVGVRVASLMKAVSKLDWEKVDLASGLSSSEALGNKLVTSNVCWGSEMTSRAQSPHQWIGGSKGAKKLWCHSRRSHIHVLRNNIVFATTLFLNT